MRPGARSACAVADGVGVRGVIGEAASNGLRDPNFRGVATSPTDAAVGDPLHGANAPRPPASLVRERSHLRPITSSPASGVERIV